MPRSRWQNEAIVGSKREPMHVQLHAHESAAHAHAAQVLREQPAPSRWVKPLTPARWSFKLASSPAMAPSVRPGVGFDAADWGDVAVPLSLESPAAGFGQTQYTNVRYPFPLRPPHIPSENNHVGSYQTTFEVPGEWLDRRVFLQFDGVGSAATVWIGARLPLTMPPRAHCPPLTPSRARPRRRSRARLLAGLGAAGRV